jgi:hypothetical protein
MSEDRSIQKIQDRPLLQPQGLNHRQHPLHELAALRALTPKGVLAPQHPCPQDPLRVVVRLYWLGVQVEFSERLL